jgi:hypothetical protein
MSDWPLAESGYSVTWDGTTVQLLYDNVLWSVTAALYASADGVNPPALAVTMDQQPPVAYAAQMLPGDTTHPTAALALITGDARQGAASWLQANGEAAFYPTMQTALVSLPAAQALAGVTAGNVAINYAQNYLAGEFNDNAAELYAQLETPLAAVFSGAARRSR